MSASEKDDLARAWLRAEKIADEEADRLAAMSDEEFERELANLPAPERVPGIEELLARGADRAKMREVAQENASAKVVDIPRATPTKKQWTAWLVAAALGVLIVLLAVERREIVAWFRPDDDIRPDNQWVEPQPDKRATAFREKAFDACHEGLWMECEDRLNDAKRIDPAGEVNPRVQAAHKAALEGMSRDLRRPDPDRKRLPEK